MTKIYVENQELDLTADLSHQLTFSIDDIRNLDSKTTSFSKTIVIPGTQKNNQIFGNLFELGNANFPEEGGNLFYNFDVSRSVNARIEINNLQAMKGVLRLMSITVDKGAIDYEVAIFGELGGFISTLASKKLEDLNFSNYDQDWTFDNIIQSWDEYRTFNITTSFDFKNPKSSERYAVVYPLELGENVSSIQAGDKIKISGGGCNDGLFTVLEVMFNDTLHLLEPTTNCSGTNITIEVQSPYGYGVVYPLIDYGVSAPVSGFTANHDFDYLTFRPALFVREYMDRIITGAGYTWQSEFFDTSFFRSLIIPNNDKYLEKRGENYYAEGTNNFDFDFDQTSDRTNVLDFPSPTLDASWSSVLGDTAYQYNNTQTLNVKATVTITGYLVKPYKSMVWFSIKHKASNGAVTEIGVYKLEDPFGYKNEQLNIILSGTVAMNDGDQLSCSVIYYHGRDCITVSGNFGQSNLECTPIEEHTFLTINNVSFTVQTEPEGFTQYQLGDTIKINDTLPKNVLQKDFFASIMKMFNLMVVESREKTRHLIIEPYVNYYKTTIDTYEDWTYKVSRDKPMVMKPMSEINARVYEFKYKEDSDYYNELYKKHFNQTYGNRDYDNSLEFAKEKQEVNIIFSPSILLGFEGEEKVWPAIYEYDESTGVKTPKAHNVRIMQIKKVEDVALWYILQNNDTSIGDTKDYLYAGHLNDPDYPTNDINWGSPKQLFFELVSGSLQYNLFNNFYSPYMAEIIDKDSRLLTCEMKLTETDIFNLDFSRFKMIDGVLCRLMKITDWSEGNLCKVDLLRVINTTYLPDTLLTTKTLQLRFDDIANADTLVGSASNVEDWNDFFDLSVGNKFSTCFVDGNDVHLIGNVIFKIGDALFKDNEYILAIYDNINSIIEIGEESFKNSSIEIIKSEKLNSIAYQAFIGSSIEEINAINLISIADKAFVNATSLQRLYLDNLQNCGSTTGDDAVFEGINGNTIYLRTNKSVLIEVGGFNPYYSEGDFSALIGNNTVNITIV